MKAQVKARLTGRTVGKEYNNHRPHRALKQAAPLRPLPYDVTNLDRFRFGDVTALAA